MYSTATFPIVTRYMLCYMISVAKMGAGMPKRQDTLTLVSKARTWLDMTANFPELLTKDDAAARIGEVRDAFSILLEFRNLVRFVSELDEPPRNAAKHYLKL